MSRTVPHRGAVRNVVLAGVGGQGVLSATRILGEALRLEGREVRLGQLHGLSQRGGSVEGTLRIGPGGTSRVGRGEADLVLALEPMEALRALRYCRPSTRMLVNRRRLPMTLLALQGRPYPPLEEILGGIRDAGLELVDFDAQALAREVGAPRALNACMLGLAAGLSWLPVETSSLVEVLRTMGPKAARKPNVMAFQLGIQTARGGTEVES